MLKSLRRKDIQVSDILAPTDGQLPVARSEGPLPPHPLDPSLYVDLYPEPAKHGLYRTAEQAGNLLAATGMRSPVEDANATGFGTMTSQPPHAQNVGGQGVWRDNFWSVLFYRDLVSPDTGDVQFIPSQPVLVAFGIWNGAQRDRDGRKVISNWHRLTLNP